MFVTIHTSIAMARDLYRAHPAAVAARRLQKIVSDLGLRLEAMHPGATDPELVSQFYVEADPLVADQVRQRIEEAGIVEAVYVKPPEGPPLG